MIGVLISIGVFRYFQKLAVRNGKVHWKYSLLGMGICISVQVLVYMMYQFTSSLFNFESAQEEPNLLIATSVTVFGWILSLAVVWYVHRQLGRIWRKEAVTAKISEIDGIGKK